MIPARNLEWDIADGNGIGAYDALHELTPGNGRLDISSGEYYTEDEFIRDSLNDAAADINIYILGGARFRKFRIEGDGHIQTKPTLAFGMARIEARSIFIDGDVNWYYDFLGHDSHVQQHHTIAHEIGHLLAGEGHANTNDAVVKLNGIQPEYLVQDRLMVTGDLTRIPVGGVRLVKGEWDEAEKWLKNRPLGDN